MQFNWSILTEQFESSFKSAFSTDKKAHFDNLPDELKVIDGAKGFWNQLLLFDGIIYILVNDSFNSSSRRAFNQHKVICDCIIQQLETINPEAHTELLKVKRTAALANGHYVPVPTEISKFLADKFSHLIAVDQLDFPWSSIANLRSNLLGFEGPPSKAKAKFAQITDLLLSNEHFAHYKDSMNTLIRTVIYRVLFVWQTPLGAMEKTTRKRHRDSSGSKRISRSLSTSLDDFDTNTQQLTATLIPSVRGNDLLLTSWSDDQFDSFFDDCQSPRNAATTTSTSDNQSEELHGEHAHQTCQGVAPQSGHLDSPTPLASLTALSSLMLPESLGSSSQDHSGATSVSRGDSNDDSVMDEDTQSLLLGETPRPQLSRCVSSSYSPSSSSQLSKPTASISCERLHALTLHVEPHATEYVMYGDVLCAVVPVSDPGLIAQARAMFGGGGGGGQLRASSSDYSIECNASCASNGGVDTSLVAVVGSSNCDTSSGGNICSGLLADELGSLPSPAFSMPPPFKVNRFNSLCADEDDTGNGDEASLSNACTQSCVTMETFESFVL